MIIFLRALSKQGPHIPTFSFTMTEPEAEQNQLETESIKASAGTSLFTLPFQVEQLVRQKGAKFTLMVAGESGLGKSTFVRAMFGNEYIVSKSNSETNELMSRDCVIGEERFPSFQTAKLNNSSIPDLVPIHLNVHPTTNVEIYQAFVTENGFTTHLTIVDTPGFGDYTNNQNTWVPIVNYIDEKHRHFMLQEEQPDRSRLLDSRVHVCLYFLAPTNRLSELDLRAMQELNTRVNVIPVIAKADSMTQEELILFKTQIRTALDNLGIKVWNPDDGVCNRSGWPFAIISSSELVLNERGKEVLGRQYRWGTVEIENPEYSDFSSLRDTLFSKGMLDLIHKTNSIHYNNVRRELRLLRLRRALTGCSENSFETPYSHQLVPNECESLGSECGNVRKTCSDHETQNKNHDILTVGEAASSMSGLETLAIISNFGSSFLECERKSKDVLLYQRSGFLKARFDVVARFQQERFDAQAAELENVRDQLNEEVAYTNDINRKLAQEIREMEVSIKKRK